VLKIINLDQGYAVSNEPVYVAAEYKRLSNGRYIGVVMHSLAGRISFDTFELACLMERESKSEALRDAGSVIKHNSSARF